METVFMPQNRNGFCMGGARTDCYGQREGETHDLIRQGGAGAGARLKMRMSMERASSGPRFDAGMKPGVRKTQTVIRPANLNIDATRHVRSMSADMQSDAGGPGGHLPCGLGGPAAAPKGNRSAL